MKSAFLIRNIQTSTYTLGCLIVDGTMFRTIERPWLDNKQNVSCIPTGKYEADFLPRSGSGKYRNVYHVKEVPGRSGILIHNGNLVSHSRGCIIIGSRTGMLGGQPAVLSSRPALRKLNALLQGESIILEVM
jgi:hypothetical protein